MPKKVDLPSPAELRALYEDGRSMDDLRLRFGAGKERIRKELLKAGAKIRPKHTPKRNPYPLAYP